MQEKLKAMLEEAKEQLSKAASLADTEEVRVKVLGKKGQLTEILRSMGKLPPEEKKALGQAANKVKSEFEQLLAEKTAEVKEKARAAKFAAEKIDVTEPGKAAVIGVKHPITQTIDEVVDIFRSMGYTVYEGPDVDTVYNTFDALNSPENHPARDLTDTFYINEEMVLRPHTSSAEIRAELDMPLPYKVLIPGRCYRVDTPDATHSPTFHQIEMMVIGEGITTVSYTHLLTIKETGKLTVIDDTYNAAPDSMKSAIDTLMHTEGGRRVAILGGMKMCIRDRSKIQKRKAAGL